MFKSTRLVGSLKATPNWRPRSVSSFETGGSGLSPLNWQAVTKFGFRISSLKATPNWRPRAVASGCQFSSWPGRPFAASSLFSLGTKTPAVNSIKGFPTGTTPSFHVLRPSIPHVRLFKVDQFSQATKLVPQRCQGKPIFNYVEDGLTKAIWFVVTLTILTIICSFLGLWIVTCIIAGLICLGAIVILIKTFFESLIGKSKKVTSVYPLQTEHSLSPEEQYCRSCSYICRWLGWHNDESECICCPADR